MRIVVLGDFQMKLSEENITEQAMEDVAKVNPDLVIALGDYGDNRVLGKPEGIAQAHHFMSKIGSTIRPILGNHDLQFETGNNMLLHGTMSSTLCDLFKLDNPHGVAEFESFRIFYISVDPQQADSCYYVQECYLTDEHFEELATNLRKRPGVPALFFTHAPSIGSGLITVPHVHVRATNAYLDQNHDPSRWFRLVQEFPEVTMWFCAHYHIGHMQPNSMADLFGTMFFMNGVHSNVTRDGDRQSRVIDITSDSVKVRTLDHRQRILFDTPDWEYNGGISGLVEKRRSILETYFAEQGTNIFHYPAKEIILKNKETSIRNLSDFVTGEGTIIPGGITEGKNKHIFTVTANGYVWEIDTVYEEALGTLHYHESPVKGIAAAGTGMWRIWDNKVEVCQLADPFRYVREFPEEDHKGVCLVLENPAQCIAGKDENSVWLGCGNQLFEASLLREEIVLKEKYSFQNIIVQMAGHQNGGLFVRTIEGERYFIDGNGKCNTKGRDEYFCNMPFGMLEPKFIDKNSLPVEIVDEEILSEPDDCYSLLGLRDNKILLLAQGRLFIRTANLKSWEEINVKGYRAAAMCKLSCDNETEKVCIAWNANEEEQLPRFQIWEIK